MRAQAIEKVLIKIVEQHRYSQEVEDLDNWITKAKIILDRNNGDRAASVIREVMNS